MTTLNKLRHSLNDHLLRHFNMRLDTLTAKRREYDRLSKLQREGWFERPMFALASLAATDYAWIERAYLGFASDMARLSSKSGNSVGFDSDNDFYRTPDVEILYLLLREMKPKRYFEIGCGNSTRVARQAIRDGGLSTEMVAIDPSPRANVRGMIDRLHTSRLEDVDSAQMLGELRAGDVLFIDSSHELRIGGDVVRLFLGLLQKLAPGVVVHVHDVFLPYDYPLEWALAGRDWNEQYALWLFLQSRRHRILWAGYHAQKLCPHQLDRLPFAKQGRAQSFWFVLDEPSR